MAKPRAKDSFDHDTDSVLTTFGFPKIRTSKRLVAQHMDMTF